MELGANHRRIISGRLAGFERTLDEIERLLMVSSEGGILNHHIDGITPDEKHLLREVIGRTRQELRAVVEEFHFESEIENTRRNVASLLACAWSDLEDTRPEKLGGYGGMQPEAAAFLSPQIQRLSDLVLAMTDVLQETGKASRQTGCKRNLKRK